MNLKERESKILEYKEIVGDLNKIIKTVVAFANGLGGEIIFGVQDVTQKILGVNEVNRKVFFESLPNKVFDSISPLVMPEFYERNLGAESILILKVHAGQQGPYFIKSLGIPNGVFVRVGAHTRKADEHYIQELVLQKQNIFYDSEVFKTAKMEDLDLALIKKIYQHTATESFLIRESIIANRQGKFYPSRAALLMFSQRPDDFLPEAKILCTLFKGTSGREIIKQHEIVGPVFEQCEEAQQIILSWLELSPKLQGVRLKGNYQLPPIALREAIINAVIHRKYSISGAVKIAFYEDRLEIFSPGCFPSVILPENLGDGSTYLRNPLLAKFARKLHLVEKLGSGIRTIFYECQNAKLARPEFKEDGDFVKLIFYFKADLSACKNSVEEIIFKLFENRQELRPQDVQAHTTLNRNTITNTFRRLIEQKKLKRFGKGRGVYYLKN